MQNKIQSFNDFLQKLVGLELFYGIKAPDLHFYDLGFGCPVESESYDQTKRVLSPYILHVTCDFEIVWKNNSHVDSFNCETHKEFFDHYFLTQLKGLIIEHVTLKNNNELNLHLKNCCITFSPFNDDVESWRIFSTIDKEAPHLVASSIKIDFE